jgi:GDPmannose 4,6-dehydratase
LGLDKAIYIGNLTARRDWGYAPEFVEAMWLMMQQEKGDDYVVATGEVHTVRELIEESARHLDMDLVWEGQGLEEKGIDRKTGQQIVGIDPKYFRPAEVDLLVGDATKAREKLGWDPQTKFHKLVELMVKADYDKESKKA